MQFNRIWNKYIGIMNKEEHCDILQVLKDAGLSRTPQRVAVLGMLINSERALTVFDIFMEINSYQKINKATVYRILSSFIKKGIIRGIPVSDGVNYYEMACRHNPLHAHFYCRACKRMFCLDSVDPFQVLQEKVSTPLGFAVEDFSFSITGLCRDCRNMHAGLQEKN